MTALPGLAREIREPRPTLLPPDHREEALEPAGVTAFEEELRHPAVEMEEDRPRWIAAGDEHSLPHTTQRHEGLRGRDARDSIHSGLHGSSPRSGADGVLHRVVHHLRITSGEAPARHPAGWTEITRWGEAGPLVHRDLP